MSIGPGPDPGPDPEPKAETESDETGTPPPSQEEAETRLNALLDTPGETYLYGFILAGEDENAWYYILILDQDYQQRMYLKERYALLTKPESDFSEDTFMKNGIDRRCGSASGPMARSLARIYMSVANIEEELKADKVDLSDIATLDPIYQDVRNPSEE